MAPSSVFDRSEKYQFRELRVEAQTQNHQIIQMEDSKPVYVRNNNTSNN